MAAQTIDIRKVWRSELRGVISFAAVGALSVYLSNKFSATVINGELFTVNGETLFLKLPILWLAPAGWFSALVFRIYNVRYSADTLGIEAREGILSMSQKITRIRYEDVRSIETDQTLFERLLDVGTVEVGTAGTAGVEMIMEGISAPNAVQDFIQNERERRQTIDPAPKVEERVSV